jgi:predicted DNA-binding transcriptional regulator YafY
LGAQLTYERYIWFDQQIRQGRYPNASTLAKKFEFSEKTAHRAIDFMATMLDAPLQYDATRKGYTYSDNAFSLPAFKVTQEELLAILVARTLLSGSAGGVISRSISRFGRKLFAQTGGVGLSEEFIDQVFSATWHGYSPGQGETFQRLVEALLARRSVSFRYRSPHGDATTFRTVHPHHLQHYMGSWVLLAWCTLRLEWRSFLLARMEELTVTEATFPVRPPAEWRPLLHDAFGIFQGAETFPVTLRFPPDRARWIQEQHWHPKQEMQIEASGSLLLTLPMADLREIKSKVLQFGAGVEVVAPKALRNAIRQEIAAMQQRYGE